MEIQHLVYCSKEECDVNAEDCDECEPEVSHKTLLDTLKDTIENKGVLYRYPDYGDE